MSLLATHTTILRNSNWTYTPGNYIEYTYFAGVDALRNPSGNTDNISSIAYYNGLGQLQFTVEYSWDSLDRMIKEECK